MKLLYILRGCPGDGKSTFANQLAKEANSDSSIICCADDYHMVGDDYVFKFENQARAHQLCKSKCDCLMTNESSRIIVANTNTTWKEIKSYVEMAAKYSYQVAFARPRYNFTAEELFNRNVHAVPLEAIQRMKSRLITDAQLKEFMTAEFPDVSCQYLTFENCKPSKLEF